MASFGGGGGGGGGQFTVFLGNLPFDCTQGDVDALFQGLNVDQVRLIHDREEGTFKGFGYVEFGDEASLQTALGYNNVEWMGRRLRIDVAQPKGQGRGGGGGGRGGFGGDRAGGGGYGGSSRGGSRGVGFGGNDGFGAPAGSGGYGEDRAGSDAFGSSRSRADRGDFQDNSAFGVQRRGGADMDPYGGAGGRADDLPPEPTAQDEAERPRLKLASRTKKDPPAASAQASRSSAIFGAAKPVNVKEPKKASEEASGSKDDKAEAPSK
ncbi:RNA-binding protein, putative [Hondaea fermentalgiana]|uniref:RNA-binding protein, putative n=1 Tax=Hondaea fermentalgiana TaxID=2315210 RepID=A0A2R5GPG9_9STRA|nr:RNA-binding protein, putative [Hondaea fermentalgiana]|eukprot:GBG32772.1 RNA-binding protein, putative [Hondaea fermentalgiana]